jgi:hypothetical protein
MNTGEAQKLQGQALTWDKERVEWRDKALTLLERYAQVHPSVQADHFHSYCTQEGMGEPHHPNVWGSLYTIAGRKKWMVKSRRYATSEHRRAHAHTYVIWYSRLCPENQQLSDPTPKQYEERIAHLVADGEAKDAEINRLKAQVAELKAELSALHPINLVVRK